MIPFLPIAVTGGIISSGFAISRKRKQERLVTILVDLPALADDSAKPATANPSDHGAVSVG